MPYRARIVVDVLLAACFVALMATALVAEAFHELLGLALFALAVVHVVLNRRRIAALTRGRCVSVRVLQLAALVGLTICIVGQVVSALVLSKHALAFLPALPGSAGARRIHMLCSYWSFVFAFAHAGLQLKGMLARIRKEAPSAPIVKGAVRVAIAIVAIFGAVSFVQLGLPSYLTGRVQFAMGDPDVVFACIRWGSTAIMVMTAFHGLRKALEALDRKRAQP